LSCLSSDSLCALESTATCGSKLAERCSHCGDFRDGSPHLHKDSDQVMVLRREEFRCCADDDPGALRRRFRQPQTDSQPSPESQREKQEVGSQAAHHGTSGSVAIWPVTVQRTTFPHDGQMIAERQLKSSGSVLAKPMFLSTSTSCPQWLQLRTGATSPR